MEEAKKPQVKISKEFLLELDYIFQYGVETFGAKQAENYENEIWQLIDNLFHNYLIFPECRYLQTKSKMYRCIILESHLIIYRIVVDRIEVLRILNSHSSISKIRSTRSLKIK